MADYSNTDTEYLSPLAPNQFAKSRPRPPHPYSRMPSSGPSRRHRKVTPLVISSYVLDWVIVIVTAAVGYVLGNITPNKRPFQLEDPDIS